MSNRQPKCGACGSRIKRTYIAITKPNWRGKSYPKYKPFGWICWTGCKKVILDE